IADNYNGDKENFTIECIQKLAIEPELNDADWKDTNQLCNKLYAQVQDTYNRKNGQMRALMFPQFVKIKEEHGEKVENIVIPFTDGVKGMQLYVDINKSIEDKCMTVTATLERNITLAMIDDSWKEHLRSMDDLRQSVQ